MTNAAFIEDLTTQTVALTADELTLLKGLVGNYQRLMLLDLRKGSLTETGIRNYRLALAEAGELMVKLGGPV
jgi:hypothetical protein